MSGGAIVQAHSAHAYKRRIEGVGSSHRERSLQKVKCEHCGTEVGRQQLKKHQMTQKCTKGRKEYLATNPNPVAECVPDPPPPPDLQSMMYHVSMDGLNSTPCPVATCPYKTEKRNVMRRHFRNMHNGGTIVVDEEGLLPRCTECGIYQMSVGPLHQQSLDCQRWSKVHRDRAADKVHRKTVAETVFTVLEVPIKNVDEFKYLGRVVSRKDDDWPAVNRNLTRARAAWGKLGRILSKEGASPKAMASVYKTVVQAVLLYGSESWVLTSTMEKKLQSFHRRCARYITGQHIRQNPDETWTCPSSEIVLEQAGLWTIQQYIKRRRNTVEPYARSRPIYQRCETSQPLASSPNQLVWWQLPRTILG